MGWLQHHVISPPKSHPIQWISTYCLTSCIQLQQWLDYVQQTKERLHIKFDASTYLRLSNMYRTHFSLFCTYIFYNHSNTFFEPEHTKLCIILIPGILMNYYSVHKIIIQYQMYSYLLNTGKQKAPPNSPQQYHGNYFLI